MVIKYFLCVYDEIFMPSSNEIHNSPHNDKYMLFSKAVAVFGKNGPDKLSNSLPIGWCNN